MRLRDENKRRQIIETAVKLFSEQPFHKVRLDDVAAAAGVGKGTVYIYFKNKEDLYYSLVYDGFAQMVDHCVAQTQSPDLSAGQKLRLVCDSLIDYGFRHPQLFEVMRTVAVPDSTSTWDAKRHEFSKLIETIVRAGVASGEFIDLLPQLTGVYVPAMVRAVMLYRPADVSQQQLAEHVYATLTTGIAKTKT